MNQILDYNPNKSSGSKKGGGSDAIVRVFAVILALFAICIIAVGAYRLVKSKEQTQEIVEAATDAKIEIQEYEENAKVIVTHDKVIDKVEYRWDDGNVNPPIRGDGKSTVEFDVPLIIGTHTLNVVVTDIDGHTTSTSKSITSETGKDDTDPVIEITTDGNKAKIVATDDIEMGYITYRWNEDEEIRVDQDEDAEDKRVLECEIDILKGSNFLVVNAVDASGNSADEKRPFNGVMKPDIKITIAADKTKATVKCTHEKGIQTVVVNLNGQDYNVDFGPEIQPEVEFEIALGEGVNEIKVTATSVESTNTVVSETVDNTVAEDNITISMTRSESDPNKVQFNAESPEGIQTIKLNINDVDYDVDLHGEVSPQITFEFELFEGNNTIIFGATTAAGQSKEITEEFTR